MGTVESFIVTFTEVISIMILWSKFGLEKKRLTINLLIVFITALVNTVTQFNIYINTISSYLVLIFLVCYFYHRSISRALLEFLFAVLLLMIIQIIVISIFGIFISIDMDDTYISLSLNMIIILLSLIIYKYVPVFHNNLVIKINKRIIAYFITNLFGYILVLKIIWDYDNNIILSNWINFILIISATIIMNTIMYFHIIKIEQEKKDAVVKAKYSGVLRNITDEIRGRQHDFKNHLNVINGLLDVTDKNEIKDKAKNYINSLNQSMINIENIVYMDNSILSAIIYSKIHEANKLNIKFVYDIKNSFMKTSLKDYELVEVLTNLIDNGFEALEKYEGQKCLRVRTYFEENMNILEVDNSGITIKPQDVTKIYHQGFSTKGKTERGLGLYNVKKIVERSGGKVQLSFEEGNTVFKLFVL